MVRIACRETANGDRRIVQASHPQQRIGLAEKPVGVRILAAQSFRPEGEGWPVFLPAHGDPGRFGQDALVARESRESRFDRRLRGFVGTRGPRIGGDTAPTDRIVRRGPQRHGPSDQGFLEPTAVVGTHRVVEEQRRIVPVGRQAAGQDAIGLVEAPLGEKNRPDPSAGVPAYRGMRKPGRQPLDRIENDHVRPRLPRCAIFLPCGPHLSNKRSSLSTAAASFVFTDIKISLYVVS